MPVINRKSFYSIISEDKYIIEIPIIQRDYAQGRKNALTTEIRKDFLKELKQYIDSNERNNDLDFVYGNLKDSQEKNVLTLLDGQQRLTTLFLLHWYAALIDGENTYQSFRDVMLNGSHSRFTYKTRYSSTDFCDHLVKFYRNDNITNGQAPESLVEYYNKKIDTTDETLSSLLINEKWFNAYWNEDPTILSMLSMLDSIKEIFIKKNSVSLYKKLTGLDGLPPAITFQFLNLKDYQLTDELYIKMNSRGRPLTRYENIKSKLLKEYELYSKTLEGKTFNNEFNSDATKSLREYISLKFDKDWIDMLWKFWLSNKNDFSEPVIDDMFLSLISCICINENIVFRAIPEIDEEGNEIPIDIDSIAKQTEKLLKKRNTIEYSTLIELFKINNAKVMQLFPKIMKLLVANKGDSFILKKYFAKSFIYVNENNLFNNICFDFKGKGLASYYDRITFYAYYKYLILYPQNEEYFQNWMRFVSNMMNNSLIDNPTRFINAFISINAILNESNGDIQTYLIQTAVDFIPTAGLYQQQIIEEKIKAILSQNEKWKNTLQEAESLLYYFKGELNYPLEFFANVSIDTVNEDKQDFTKLDVFQFAVKRLNVIFGKVACSFPNTLSRALLSKGNYLRPIGNMESFLTDTGKKTRDLSWKTYLGDTRTENNIRRQLFSNLLYDIDDNSCTKESIQKTLENICQNSLVDSSIELWRKKFISTPGIFDWLGSNYRYIERVSNDEIYVLGSDNRGKYHTELFTLSKYFELKQKNFFTAPFDELTVWSEMGKNTTLGFQFKDKDNSKDRKPYHFLCEYAGNSCFYLSFFGDWDKDNKNHRKISNDKLRSVLESLKYKEQKDNVFWKETPICEENLEIEIKKVLSGIENKI